MRIEVEREEDGRWLSEIPELPGVMACGQTQDEALARVRRWHLGFWPTGLRLEDL